MMRLWSRIRHFIHEGFLEYPKGPLQLDVGELALIITRLEGRMKRLEDKDPAGTGAEWPIYQRIRSLECKFLELEGRLFKAENLHELREPRIRRLEDFRELVWARVDEHDTRLQEIGGRIKRLEDPVGTGAEPRIEQLRIGFDRLDRDTGDLRARALRLERGLEKLATAVNDRVDVHDRFQATVIKQLADAANKFQEIGLRISSLEDAGFKGLNELEPRIARLENLVDNGLSEKFQEIGLRISGGLSEIQELRDHTEELISELRVQCLSAETLGLKGDGLPDDTLEDRILGLEVRVGIDHDDSEESDAERLEWLEGHSGGVEARIERAIADAAERLTKPEHWSSVADKFQEIGERLESLELTMPDIAKQVDRAVAAYEAEIGSRLEALEKKLGGFPE